MVRFTTEQIELLAQAVGAMRFELSLMQDRGWVKIQEQDALDDLQAKLDAELEERGRCSSTR